MVRTLENNYFLLRTKLGYLRCNHLSRGYLLRCIGVVRLIATSYLQKKKKKEGEQF